MFDGYEMSPCQTFQCVGTVMLCVVFSLKCGRTERPQGFFVKYSGIHLLVH